MLLNGRSDLSGLMALRIEKAFGVRMETLMRMQASYDIARTRRREGEVTVGAIAAENHPYPPTNPYTTTFSTSMSSLSTPRTSPPATSRIRNLGGV